MKQFALVALVVTIGLGVFAVPALSQTSSTDTVSVSVSPAVTIAVSIDEDVVDFDTLSLSGGNSSRTQSNPSQLLTAHNEGNVPVDLLIAASNALPSSGQPWLLSCDPSTAGTVGFDQYVLRSWLESMGAGSAFALCTTDQTLATDVSPGGDGVGFRLKLAMPTGTSVFGLHTSTVTVTAMQ